MLRIVNSGVISTYPPILSQGSQNEHSPSYHKISSLITSVQGKGVHIELHKVLDMQEMRFTAIHTQKISMTGGRFKTIIKSKRLL
ncbi:hypothetical protein LOD99_14480 [Oopsacas minuta]|uniref:Uncharacterized protein n=1 Tax=Oopsacas minuta TaxID=111878 RepID=A0AAV7KDX5_9METZ|nr:hypothetical protein LOD99_14480 [Oopsacas minuta]